MQIEEGGPIREERNIDNIGNIIMITVIIVVVVIYLVFLLADKVENLFSSKTYYLGGVAFILFGAVIAIINIFYDLKDASSNISYATRDATHWTILFGAALITLAIYYMHIERYSLERLRYLSGV